MPHLRPVPDTPPRAVLYLRQSVTREESISLALQETACRQHAERSGYVVVDVVSDPGISGRTWKRPGVVRVMAMVEAHEAEIVILWKWSRLSRSRRDWALAADRVEVAGGRIESATEAVDVATSVGRLARGVLTEFAAFESERMGEVWKEVHARRLAHGLPAHGGSRFGYELDAGTYTPDPITGPVLAAMYRDYAAGIGFKGIAARLAADGIPTPRGGTWYDDGVKRILDSGFGAGQLVVGRRGPLTYFPGVHPTVIEPVEWEAYLRARRTRRRQPAKVSGPKYPLAGLIMCGDCGGPMWASRLGREPGYGYVCGAWATARTCRCVSVSRAKAERAVLDWLQGLASDVEALVSLHQERETASATSRAEAHVVRGRIDRLEQRLTRLTLGWSDGTVPASAYVAARDELQVQLRALEEQSAAMLDAAEVTATPAGPVAQRLVDEWDELAVGERRALLATLIARVRVVRPATPGRVEVVVDGL